MKTVVPPKKRTNPWREARVYGGGGLLIALFASWIIWVITGWDYYWPRITSDAEINEEFGDALYALSLIVAIILCFPVLYLSLIHI